MNGYGWTALVVWSLAMTWQNTPNIRRELTRKGRHSR